MPRSRKSFNMRSLWLFFRFAGYIQAGSFIISHPLNRFFDTSQIKVTFSSPEWHRYRYSHYIYIQLDLWKFKSQPHEWPLSMDQGFPTKTTGPSLVRFMARKKNEVPWWRLGWANISNLWRGVTWCPVEWLVFFWRWRVWPGFLVAGYNAGHFLYIWEFVGFAKFSCYWM